MSFRKILPNRLLPQCDSFSGDEQAASPTPFVWVASFGRFDRRGGMLFWTALLTSFMLVSVVFCQLANRPTLPMSALRNVSVFPA